MADQCKGCKQPINWIETRPRPTPVNPGRVIIKASLPGDKQIEILTADGELVTGTPLSQLEVQIYQKHGLILKAEFVPHKQSCTTPEMFQKGRKRNGKGLSFPSRPRLR